MTAIQIAIKWCNDSHPLQDLPTIALHERGSCCAECGPVARAISDALAAAEQRVAELEAALADVLSLHDFSYLDKGIGVLTPDGAKLLRARAAHRAAGTGKDG